MNRLIAFFHALSIVVAVIAILYAFIVFTGLLFGCVALSQEDLTINVEPPMRFASTNGVQSFIDTNGVTFSRIERRGPQPPIPPLPPIRKISRSVSTNDQGEKVKVTVEIEKPADPPPLPQSRYMTNIFDVMCPRCRVTAHRVPKRVEEVGVLTVPEGDELDLTLYFVCCSKEFRAKSKVFVETPIAKIVR